MAKLDLSNYSGIEDGDLTTLNKVKDVVGDKASINELLKTNTDYDLLYNLSENRCNILCPCNIEKSDECLELFSETGILSSAIAKECKSLDCIDPSKVKSEINYKRNNKVDNINIYVGNFKHILEKSNKKYDKIFLIGGLRFSSFIFEGNDSCVQLLRFLKEYLKEGGCLYVAAENKYGIKYFNGAREDYTGNIFESILGYSNEAKTFSSVQLRDFLKVSGYSNVFFYYPLPDYKFPNTIFSEKYLPEDGMISDVGHSFDKDRVVIFNEDMALTDAAKSGMFEFLTNSFLIKASK